MLAAAGLMMASILLFFVSTPGLAKRTREVTDIISADSIRRHIEFYATRLDGLARPSRPTCDLCILALYISAYSVSIPSCIHLAPDDANGRSSMMDVISEGLRPIS